MATFRASITVDSPDVLSTPVSLTTGLSATVDSGHIIKAKVNATGQGSAAVTVYKANDKADTAFIFVRNLSTDQEKSVTVYFGTRDIVKIGGGQFAFFPVDSTESVNAFASELGLMIEYAVFGVDNTSAQLD